MAQFFAGPLTEAGGPSGFGDALGADLIIWAVVTAGLTKPRRLARPRRRPALAMYLGLAIVANTTAGRDVLPIR